jgi:hypothetical protein
MLNPDLIPDNMRITALEERIAKGDEMNSFIAQPNNRYFVGQSICRSKRRCDVVHLMAWVLNDVPTLHDPLQLAKTVVCTADHQDGVRVHKSRLSSSHYKSGDCVVVYRPMTWWESLRHELFEAVAVLRKLIEEAR